MEKFLDNTPIPWVKVTDPSTGEVYYSTATHEYADRNGPDPTFLQNVIIEPTESGATDTGSLLTSASFRDPDLTFTKGDGSTFDVDISTLTVVSASFASTASYLNETSIITLNPQSPLPSNVPTGSFAVSSSNPPIPYFWDGSIWRALYVIS